MNERLDMPYTAEEVRTALFQMAPSKAPGVDGFTTGFFQRHWSLLKDDIVPSVLDFLNGGVLPKGMNDTSITLIPKVRHPHRIAQYHPISSCSVLYKIASKCITNRMRVFMGKIISEEQSAFVPGRLITDNVLIAYESVHAMKRRKKGKNIVCAVKLDMMKAYDRVDWYYLEAIMLRLGFSSQFVRLIMKCVTSVRFTIRVNGELLPHFTPSRGFRQGDPVSPYLFLLCAEGFTSLLKFYGGANIDRGIRVSYQSPWVNHLLFVDDSFIFMNAQATSAIRLNEVLQIYGDCSGQCINRDKSSIYFSPNTPEPVRLLLKEFLNISVEAFSERYLGLPTVVDRITSGTFEFLRERMRSKLQGGVERLISCAGREVRLKAVAQAIPTHSMSCFKLTEKVYKGLSSVMARYWWSSSIDRRSLHWIDWPSLAEPKVAGGMGFRNLELFNLALLGKHGWNLIMNPDSLCARVLKGKYFPQSDFMAAPVPKCALATWRAICARRHGDGTSVSIRQNNWVPGLISLWPTIHICNHGRRRCMTFFGPCMTEKPW